MSVLVILCLFATAVSCGENDSRPKLEIWPQAPVQTKSVGSKILLTCRIAPGAPAEVRNLEWLDPNNRTINPNDPILKDRMTVLKMPNDKSVLLIFQDFQKEEQGQYTCKSSTSNYESIAASVLIETIEPITWVDAPLTQNLIKGKEGKIKCQVTANPMPDVDWVRKNQTITSRDRYIVESNGLTIKNAQESDQGSYTCRAIVIQTGEFSERVIKVEVQSPPKMDNEAKTGEIEDTKGESRISTNQVTVSGNMEQYIIKSSDLTDKGVRSPELVNFPGLMMVLVPNLTLTSTNPAAGHPRSVSGPKEISLTFKWYN